MPYVSILQFNHDHHALTYMTAKEDGYAFSINTVTGKLESACMVRPKKIITLCHEWSFHKCKSDQDMEVRYLKPRTVKLKVTPLRSLPYTISWVTTEMLPNAARAIWNKQYREDAPVKCVSAWVEGGPVVKHQPWQGFGDPVKHCVFSAGFGGEWLPMKYTETCPVFDMTVSSAVKA